MIPPSAYESCKNLISFLAEDANRYHATGIIRSSMLIQVELLERTFHMPGIATVRFNPRSELGGSTDGNGIFNLIFVTEGDELGANF